MQHHSWLHLNNKESNLGIRYTMTSAIYIATTAGSFKHYAESKQKGYDIHCDECSYEATTAEVIRKKNRESQHERIRYLYGCDMRQHQQLLALDHRHI